MCVCKIIKKQKVPPFHDFHDLQKIRRKEGVKELGQLAT